MLASVLCAVLSMSLAVPSGPSEQRPRLWFGFFMKGPGVRPADPEALNKMQAGHMANLQRLAAAKKLLAAGPLKDPTQQRRGIVVFRATTQEEIKSFFAEDDYVKAEIMTMAAWPWNADEEDIPQSYPDPNKIAENRFVIYTRTDKAISREKLVEHRRYVRSTLRASLYGDFGDQGPMVSVAFVAGNDHPDLPELAKNDPLVAAGLATVEVIPLWMVDGGLKKLN
jgi:uncharacterized protein YciI